jgi:hypothetical protein
LPITVFGLFVLTSVIPLHRRLSAAASADSGAAPE